MEKRAEDLPRAGNLNFAKNPFEIRKFITSRTEQKRIENVEDFLKLEPPREIRPVKPCENFPKSNFSHLTFDSPSFERKQVREALPPSTECVKPDKQVQKDENQVIKEDFSNRDFIKLEKWFLLLNPSTEKVVLCGFRADLEEMWLSDSVSTRIDRNKIVTNSNMCYELVGPLDSINQKSLLISSKFEEGFPDNWKEIIHDHLK